MSSQPDEIKPTETSAYSSYLVRIWCEESDKRDAGWQAEVKQIQTGEKWKFNSREALLELFQHLPQPSDYLDTKNHHTV